VPFSPVFPVIGTLLCVYLMAQLPLGTWIRFFGWLAAGILIYVLYGYRHSRLRRAAVALHAEAAQRPR
jgi:basic amino acid/polyamine antiporter, APA family